MILTQLITNNLVFLFGAAGILRNRRNVLIVLMCLELMLLGINLNFILFSVYLDDCFGQLFALFILTVAAAEAGIGLALLIAFFEIRKNIAIVNTFMLKM